MKIHLYNVYIKYTLLKGKEVGTEIRFGVSQVQLSSDIVAMGANGVR